MLPVILLEKLENSLGVHPSLDFIVTAINNRSALGFPVYCKHTSLFRRKRPKR